jgi:hypothetical protein
LFVVNLGLAQVIHNTPEESIDKQSYFIDLCLAQLIHDTPEESLEKQRYFIKFQIPESSVCGSGSISFWASWIRIRNLFARIRILSSTSKEFRKTLILSNLNLFYDFLSLKNDVNVQYLHRGKSIKT